MNISSINMEAVKTQLIEQLLQLSSSKPLLGLPTSAAPPPLPPLPSLPSVSNPLEVTLNQAIQQMVETLEKVFKDPQERAEPIRLISRFFQELPWLSSSVFRMMDHLDRSQEKPLAFVEVLRLVSEVAQNHSERTSQVKPLALLGLNQQTAQWISQMEEILQPVEKTPVKNLLSFSPVLNSANEEAPKSLKISVAEVAQFLTFALKERPETFESELFSMAVSHKVGLPLTTYLGLTHKIEPLRLALLLVEATKKEGGVYLRPLLAELTKGLNEGLDLEEAVKTWEKNLSVPKPTSVNGPVRLIYPEEGMASVAKNQTTALSLVALSKEEGLLPPTAWTLEPDLVDNALKGSLYMAHLLPVGFNRIRFKAKKGEASSVFEFLFDTFMALGDEEPSEKEERTEEPTPYDKVETKESLQAPLSGEIGFSVGSPFILMKGPFQKPIPSELHYSFQFLSEIVDPHTLYSREQYLTLPQSQEAMNFRSAVTLLQKRGMEGYDAYLKALNALLGKMGDIIPSAHKTLESIRTYLRDDVLLFLMGKKNKTLAQKEILQVLETSKKGDLMASLCTGVALNLHESERSSEALIMMADAVSLAETKPHYLKGLQDFFNRIKAKLKGSPALPLLPERAQGFKKNENLELPELFMKKFKTITL